MFWPFKKKKKIEEVTDGKFKRNDFVYFQHRGDRTFGYVVKAYKAEDGSTVYDIQVGGQCPYFLYGKKEDDLHIKDY